MAKSDPAGGASPTGDDAALSAELLRNEIVESVKIRADYLKWKVLLIAGLGSAAFGLTGQGYFLPALALVPLVCLYVDALCAHNDRRILTVAEYLKNGYRGRAPNGRKLPPLDHVVPNEYLRRYELLCGSARPQFEIEKWALWVTTVFMSIIVFAFGAGLVIYSGTMHFHSDWKFAGSEVSLWIPGATMAVSGVIGVVFGCWIEKKSSPPVCSDRHSHRHVTDGRCAICGLDCAR